MMAEGQSSNRRVVATEIDWSSAMLFPRLGRAFMMAAQPGRLMMGLAIVVILMIGGSLWDAVAGPSPAAQNGRLISTTPIEDEEELSRRLDRFVQSSIIGGTTAGEALQGRDDLSVDEVRSAIADWYRELDDEAKADARAEVELTLDVLDAMEPRGAFAATVESMRGLADRVEYTQALTWPSAVVEIAVAKLDICRSLWATDPAFVIIYGLFFMVIMLLGGAMIARSVACEFAINQFIPWPEALAFALRRWMAILGTVVLPAIIVLIAFLLLAIGGLLLRVPGLNVVGAVLYGPALFGGFILAAMLVLLALGAGMMAPAIAVEASDAPDALSRSFAYVKNRPLHLLWYMFVAAIIGIAGFFVVAGLAFLTINLTAHGAALFTGMGEITAAATARNLLDYRGELRPLDLDATGRAAVAIIELWKTLIGGIVAGFVIAYAWSAWTVIYFLMRKAVDDQDFDELWIPGMIEGTLAPERRASAE